MLGQQAGGRRTDLLFDARHIQQSGIGTYIRTQLPHLQTALARSGLTLTVLGDSETLPDLGAHTQVVDANPPSAGMYTPSEQLVWQRAFAATRPRAVWLPHYPFPMARLLPANRGIQLYTTVHDTIHLLPRDVSDQGAAKRLYARAMLAADGRFCRRIFTPSEATKTTLAGIVAPSRVLVTPIPVDEVWFEPADLDLSPLAGPFLIYVGNTKRHKNLPLVIEAFSAIADTIPHKLVIAGGGASLRTLDDRVRQLAEAAGNRVIVTGQVDFAVLRALIASAQLLIMPSLYEGAGLPPLEAMASGTAVLSSAIPALRETCGDGADYFEPHDRDGLAQLVARYCADDAARADLARTGHAHVVRRQQQISATAAADAICRDLASP